MLIVSVLDASIICSWWNCDVLRSLLDFRHSIRSYCLVSSAYLSTLHYLIVVFYYMPLYTPIAVVPEWELLFWFYLVYCTTMHNVMTSFNVYLVVVLRCTLLWCLGLCQVLVLWSWSYNLICMAIQFKPLMHFTYVLPFWLQCSCGNGAGVYVVSI